MLYKKLITIVLFFIQLNAQAQLQPNANLLDTLSMLSNGNSISKHFAKLYYDVIVATNNYAKKTDAAAQDAVFSFEQKFASLFFTAHQCYIYKKQVPWEWRNYYTDTSLNKHQYLFMGMNAHINGNMWDALMQALSYDTLHKYKKLILKYQYALNEVYSKLYKETLQYKKVATLNKLSLGFAKKYGSLRMRHWRKKQINIALLSFKNTTKFNRKLRLLTKKMKRLDKVVLKWLN